jgi:hypothetical protein
LEVIMTMTTSRRAVLAGAAALPALALPAMAASQSDRELFALDRELEAAHARMTEAFKITSEVSERYHAMRPPTPAEPQPPAGFEDLWKTITVGQLATLPADHQINVWLRETEERRLAIRRKHSAKCQRLMRKCGVNVAEANASKLADGVWKIGKRIFATQAHTIDGIKIKFRTAERLDPDKETLEDAWASLKKDILALGGSTAVQS